MLALFSNASACPLFSKLCQHNLPTPTEQWKLGILRKNKTFTES